MGSENYVTENLHDLIKKATTDSCLDRNLIRDFLEHMENQMASVEAMASDVGMADKI